MKKIQISLIAFLSIWSLAFTACSDTTDPVIGATTPATLVAPSPSEFVLALENADETMTMLTWNKADFGAQVAITYDVQMDMAGNNFEKMVSLGTTNETSMAIKTSDINKQLLNRDQPAGEPASVEIRVVSSIGTLSGLSNYESGLSNVVQLTVTPYSGEKVYPMLYTPGNHQGWKPESAAPLYSLNSDGIYSGYVYLDGEFKFTSQSNWDGTNYGAGAAAGQISETGGNITVPAAYYFAKVNTNDLTYSLRPMAWGVIGDATPTGWDSDTKLIYDPGDMTLKLDIKLKDGTLKFRANDDWADNFGGSFDNLVAGGDNITVTAGSYTIVLDFSKPVYSARLIAK